MEIKRNTYLQKLIVRKHNGMIKVITGIRRCGKSYLLFNLFRNHLLESKVNENHIIEINFDAIENQHLQDALKTYEYIKERIIDNEMYYILLDEVQLLNNFESVLNSFLRLSNVDIYVTGSNAKFLSKDVITEFRGRGDQVHVYPLSFSEFFSVYSGEKYEALQDYMYYGGLPLITKMFEHEQKAKYLLNLFTETYIKDIINRNKIRNKAELEELLNILSSNIGSLTNPRKLSNTFKSVKNVSISEPTLKSYLEYLTDSFLIEKAIRYDIKEKKYIDTPAKYYFTDTGLRNARLNFRQLEDSHLLENLIYNELRIRGYSVDVGVVEINNKDKSKKYLEVHFICNKVDRRIYIQSALSIPDQEKLNQEQKSLVNINDSFKKIIITRDPRKAHYTDNGILIMSVMDFLLNINSLD